MRGVWGDSRLILSRYCTVRRFLLPGFSALAAAILTAGLPAPRSFAHGRGIDRNKRNQQVERTAPADPRVLVSACTLSGDFTVRSWNRNEVRVRVSGGADVELLRVDQNKSEQAAELRLTSKGHRSSGSCLMFGDVEIDAPRGATVKLTTTSGDISVVDLARVNATTTSGSIGLAKIQEETSATVIGGDLSVRDSTGSFRLHSTGGSIEARDLRPVAASDTFNSSTVSGEVILTNVQHQRVSVSSVSGEVAYTGVSLPDGNYNFENLSGEVRLVLPPSASFRLVANIGGSVKISSDFDLKYAQNQTIVTPGNRGEPRHIRATVGSGESLIRVSLLTGSLRISKR